MMNKSRTICPKAWKEIAISPSGLATPCCIYEEPLKDLDGNYLTIEKNTFEELWNSQNFKDIRLAMLNGEEIAGCKQCYDQEDKAGVSRRTETITHYKEYDVDVPYEKTQEDGGLELNPTSIDLKLGNKCNLACRMCQPKDSNFVTKEFNEVAKVDPKFLYYQNTIPYDPHLLQNYDELGNWSSTEDFIVKFKQIAPYIKNLNIAGGEPLLQEEFFQIVDIMEEVGSAQDCQIYISTNLSVINKKIEKLISIFDKVHWGISVDAHGELLKYIRYPLDWKKFEKNTKTLSKMCEGKSNVLVSLCVTIQVYNVLNVERLLKYYYNEFVPLFEKHPYNFFFNQLTYPEHLSINILPIPVKEKAAKELKKYLKISKLIRHSKANDLTYNGINKIINTLINKNIKSDPNLCKSLLNYSKALDKKRNQSFAKELPYISKQVQNFVEINNAIEKPNFTTIKTLAWAKKTEGLFEESRLLFNIITDEVDDYSSCIALAEIYHEEGKLKKSITFYEKALKIDPLDSNIKKTLGWVCKELGDLEKSLMIFSDVLNENHEDKIASQEISYLEDDLKKKFGNTDTPIKIEKDGSTYDLHVMWSIHNKCNYKCSYCPDLLNSGNMTWMKLEHFKGFIEKIYNHYVLGMGYKNILFSFTGGEPTLWPEFKHFLSFINERGFRVGLTTNASVNSNYWKSVSTFFDYICLSFHPESADIDSFVKTFEYLHNAEETVIPAVRIMMHSEKKYWDKSLELIERIKKFPNWTYECVHILDDYGMESKKIDYGSFEKESFLKENSFKSNFTKNEFVHLPEVQFKYKVGYENNTTERLDENLLINNNQARFNGWDCFIGLEQLFVQFNGIVKRAGCNVGSYLGTISEFENINFPTEPIKCNRPTCHCPTDIRISKYAPGIDYDLEKVIRNNKIKQIKTETSPIKFRLTIILNEESSPSIDYFNELSKFIKNLQSELSISADEILVNYEVFFDEILNSDVFCQHLESVNVLTQIEFSDTLIDPRKIEKQILLASQIKITVTSLKNIEWISICSNAAHAKSDGSVYIVMDAKKILDVKQGIENLVLQSEDYAYCNIRIENLDKSMVKYKKVHEEIFNYDKVAKIFTIRKMDITKRFGEKARLFPFFNDENILTDDNQIARINSSSTIKPNSYFDWNCFKGIDNLVVDANANIRSSKCSQSKILGTLLEQPINPCNILLNHAQKCKQEHCEYLSDSLIRKEK